MMPDQVQPILYAQGDILIEKVADITADPAKMVASDPDGAVVLSRGERSGHRHVVREGAILVHEELKTRGMPRDLYLGHLIVTADIATVTHEEHAGIALPRGTYRIRRQRQHTAAQERGTRLVAD